ncbi:hypothetical protein [Vallitalea okinawensis]|uniref:hypothetical protein n=1 Tax=Vallitalea okinawensis TaxID=2078660 RepID=UPI000CFC6278|nr:hypothetical protein [Vallitalea okinawensis]
MEEERRNEYYSYGNLATQPSRQPERKRKVVRKKKVVRRVNYDILKSKLLYLGFVVYAFSLGLVYVVGSSFISTKQTDIETLQVDLNNIAKENLLLTEQLEKVNDLDYIYNKATGELGMGNPDTSQVKYITLANLSYSEPLQAPKESKKRIQLSFKP